jgi:TonB family protein
VPTRPSPLWSFVPVLLAVVAARADAAGPFASWLADVASPSARLARVVLGRPVPAAPLGDVLSDHGRPLGAVLLRSVPWIRADAARRSGLDGQGVLVAVIDSGVDFAHPAFAGPDGVPRIATYVELPPDGGGADPIVFSATDLARAIASPAAPRPRPDVAGHGTAVASVAAGSCGDYRGVAPAATLVVVRADRLPGGRFDEVDVVEALEAVFDLADRRGMPCVANLSLGGQLGAHDGGSALERAIDRLTGPGRPGRLVVTAAGNDARAAVHASLRGDDPGRDGVDVLVPPNAPLAGAPAAVVLVDLWSAPGGRFGVAIDDPAGHRTSAGPGEASAETALADGAFLRIEIGPPDPLTARAEALVALTGGADGRVPPGRYRLRVFGSAAVDAWLSAEATATSFLPFHLDGAVVARTTLSIPATARHAVSVGSIDLTGGWRNHLGEWIEDPWIRPGSASAFSGLGPTSDGRLKPDLAAPGAWVLAARSSSVLDPRGPGIAIATAPDARFAAARGTSLAAPHVAGAAALLLQAEPGLDAPALRERLLATVADTDGWRPDVGFGTLDVAAAAAGVAVSAPGERVVARLSSPDSDADRIEIAVTFRDPDGRPRAVSPVRIAPGPGLRPGPREGRGLLRFRLDRASLPSGACARVAVAGDGWREEASICAPDTGPSAGGCAVAPGASDPRFVLPLVPWLLVAASRRRRWAGVVAGSLLAHAALLLGTGFLLPGDRPPRAGDPPHVALDWVALPEPPPPVPPPPRTRALPPPARPPVADRPADPRPPAADPAARSPRPRQPGRLTPASPADPAAVGGVLPAFPAADVAAGDPIAPAEAEDPPAAEAAPPPVDPGAGADACAAAAADVRRRVEAVRRYPALAVRRGLTGVSEVVFRVTPDGRPAALRIDRSSGHDLLDREALEAVRRAGTLPGTGCEYVVPIRFGLGGAPP